MSDTQATTGTTAGTELSPVPNTGRLVEVSRGGCRIRHRHRPLSLSHRLLSWQTLLRCSPGFRQWKQGFKSCEKAGAAPATTSW